MQPQIPLGLIIIVIALIPASYQMVRWGILAWRYPEMFKEKIVETTIRFYRSEAYLWIFRITTLIYGVTLLLLFLMLVFYLLGLFKIN